MLWRRSQANPDKPEKSLTFKFMMKAQSRAAWLFPTPGVANPSFAELGQNQPSALATRGYEIIAGS